MLNFSYLSHIGGLRWGHCSCFELYDDVALVLIAELRKRLKQGEQEALKVLVDTPAEHCQPEVLKGLSDTDTCEGDGDACYRDFDMDDPEGHADDSDKGDTDWRYPTLLLHRWAERGHLAICKVLVDEVIIANNHYCPLRHSIRVSAPGVPRDHVWPWGSVT